MRLLLDTHVFLWWRSDAPELPERLRAHILNPENEVLVSAAVIWEIAIKRRLGKLEFEGSIIRAVEEEGFKSLAISGHHAEETERLPGHHRDPFDRLLIAQARRDDLMLLTVDPVICRYDGFAILSA